jgi:hypothetical protein
MSRENERSACYVQIKVYALIGLPRPRLTRARHLLGFASGFWVDFIAGQVDAPRWFRLVFFRRNPRRRRPR